MQVRHLVQNAMDKFGYRRFAVLFPDDPYGQEYAHLFWDEVLKRGGTIQGAQPYSPDETDFRAPIQRLVGTYYVSDRQKEYKARLKEWEAKRSARSDNPDGLLPPIVDFDAIFIPDNTRAVGQIAPMLAYNDVDNVALLGTNLWNSNSLIDRGKRFVEGALFVDGVLIGDSEYLKRPFVQEFSHVFSGEKTPGIFEIQGYDSALILRTLIAGGATTREELGAQLRLVKGLTGAVGPLNMSEKREIERPVLALKVEKGQFQKLEDSKLQ
jgi:ABC-type branched-subunit amino acid transport system substrate-binding protein